MMLEYFAWGKVTERILFFMNYHGETFSTEIAHKFEFHLYGVQKQFNRFEKAGMVRSRYVGRTRVFSWNPDWPMLRELRAFLSRAFEEMDKEEKEPYLTRRNKNY